MNNNAFSLLRTLQVGGLFFAFLRIYDRDCSFSLVHLQKNTDDIL